jgi:DNA-nicking Smr family endonuclease
MPRQGKISITCVYRLDGNFEQAHRAYEQGDGAAAHALSEEGKKHGAQMEAYNRQASEFIFRQNNADGRVASDTIDLHGQFVEEAEDILEQRIRYAQSTGQTHLHVIVGRGNHSPHHIQKIRPRVTKVCQELGLQYHTEGNEGRIYVNLTGGPANAPPPTHAGGTQYGGGQAYPEAQAGYPGAQQHHQGGHPQHQQAHGHHQGQGQNDEMEKIVKKFLPRIIRKLEKQCCIVM